MEAARSLIHTTGVPKNLWVEAIAFVVYTLNRTTTISRSKTPYEIWHKKKPNLSHLRVFGAKAFVHIPDKDRKKLDAKSRICILVGYCSTQKGYRLWDPSTKETIISRDVIFNETTSESSSNPENGEGTSSLSQLYVRDIRRPPK